MLVISIRITPLHKRNLPKVSTPYRPYIKRISFSFIMFTQSFLFIAYDDTRGKRSESRCKLACKRFFELLTMVSFIFQRNNIAVLFLYPYEKMIYHKVSLNFLHIDIHLYFLLQLPARLLA